MTSWIEEELGGCEFRDIRLKKPRVLRELYEMRKLSITDEQLRLLMQEQLESLREEQYGASSERYKKPVKKPEEPKAPAKPRVKKPSERYPHLPIREQCVVQDPAPSCQGGVKDLPPQSLIELTHSFADFVSPAYTRIQKGVLQSRVLNADETPHRMLEGSDKKSWYLWGFSTPEHCFLECHDTRSGDVASKVLLKSCCEILVTDVYSGYGKATRIANEQRQRVGLVHVQRGGILPRSLS